MNNVKGIDDIKVQVEAGSFSKLFVFNKSFRLSMDIEHVLIGDGMVTVEIFGKGGYMLVTRDEIDDVQYDESLGSLNFRAGGANYHLIR